MHEKVIKIGNTLADMMYLNWTNVIKVTSSLKEIWHQQFSFSNDLCTFTIPITFLQVPSTTMPIFLPSTTPMMLPPMETYTILSTTSFPYGCIYYLSTRRKHISSHPKHSQPHAKLWINFFRGSFQFFLGHLHHCYGLPEQYYCHQIFSHLPIFSFSYPQNCLKMGECFFCKRRKVFHTDVSKTCMVSASTNTIKRNSNVIIRCTREKISGLDSNI